MPMTTTTSHAFATAACGLACVVAGAVWVDSGLALGLVVVDSNRPALRIGLARGLLEQFGAAH